MSQGAVHELLRLAYERDWSVCSSAYAVDEARRNILQRYPEYTARLESYLESVALVDEPPTDALAEAILHGLPAKDAPILAGAIQAGCDYLVTGDKRHFGHLYGQVVQGVQVLSPREALERVLNAQT